MADPTPLALASAFDVVASINLLGTNTTIGTKQKTSFFTSFFFADPSFRHYFFSMEGEIENQEYSITKEVIQLRELCDHYRKQRDVLSQKLMSVEKGETKEEKKNLKREWRHVETWREMWINELAARQSAESALKTLRSQELMHERSFSNLQDQLQRTRLALEFMENKFNRSGDLIAELTIVIEEKDEELQAMKKKLKL